MFSTILLVFLMACGEPKMPSPPTPASKLTPDQATTTEPASPAVDEEPKSDSIPAQRPSVEGVTLGVLSVTPDKYLVAAEEQLTRYLEKWAYCFEKARKTQPLLEGSLVVKFAIGQGHLKERPSFTQNTVHNQILEGCVISRAMKISALTTDEPIWISAPLHFVPPS